MQSISHTSEAFIGGSATRKDDKRVWQIQIFFVPTLHHAIQHLSGGLTSTEGQWGAQEINGEVFEAIFRTP